MKSGATLKITALTLIMLFAVTSWAQVTQLKKSKHVKVPKGWVYIPQGQLVLNKDTTKIEAFYMLETELSNFDYKEYLNSLKSQGKTAELAIAQVDTLKWCDPNAYNEPFVSYYFQHLAFSQYPLVNISYESAQLYCKWLTERLNKTLKGITVEAMLPNRAQWIWAARGGIKKNFNSPYSWGNPYLINKKGAYMCNFKACGEQSIHYNSDKKSYEIITDWVGAYFNDAQATKSASITAPVKSYYKNGYGLYNMNGNVAEMIAEKGVAVGGSWKSPGYDVRNESTIPYNGASTTVGFRPILKFTFQ